MSALDFLVHPTGIFFATDSLSLAAKTKDPYVFQTKFVVLPHLELAVAGTGDARFVNSWFEKTRSGFIAKDIDHLDQYCPNALQELWATFKSTTTSTSTTYHFGYSKQRERYVGYAYRSEDNFISEPLRDGFGTKPATEVSLSEKYEFPKLFIEIMTRQHDEDRALPKPDRVGIGGDIHFVQMMNRHIGITQCHRFPTYDEDYSLMCRAIREP